MDAFRIIKQKGYRREDLSEHNQEILSFCDMLIESLENLKDNLDYIDEECIEESTIAKIKKEYANKVINGVVEWLEMELADMQVNLAESENVE